MSAAQIGDVDGIDWMISQSFAQFPGLLSTCFCKFGIALAIDERKWVSCTGRPGFPMSQ